MAKDQLDLFQYPSIYKDIEYTGDTNVAKRTAKIIVQSQLSTPEESYNRSILYNHSLFCQVFFPSRSIPENELEIKSGPHTTILHSHRLPTPNGQSISPGLPYGPAARLLIYFFHTQAVKSKSRYIDLGKGISDICQKLNGHRTSYYINSFKQQLLRIRATSVSAHYVNNNEISMHQVFIINELYIPRVRREDALSSAILKKNGNEAYARLSQDYYDSFISSAVPLDEDAINAFKHSAMQLDIYAWLTYKMATFHGKGINAGKDYLYIGWASLKSQFGPNYFKIADFKRDFRKALYHVTSVYSTAKITEVTNKGFKLFPSPTHVPMRKKVFAIA